MQTLDRDEALAILLTQNGLTRGFDSAATALNMLIAVQTQYVQSLQQAIGARVPNLKPSWHDRHANDLAVKGWGLRGTLQTHSPENYDLVLDAIGGRMVEKYRQWFCEQLSVEPATLDQWHDALAEKLQGSSLTRPQVHELVPELGRLPFTGWGSDVRVLAYEGRLSVEIASRGQTRFRAWKRGPKRDRDEAGAELLRRYFHAYGPATEQDALYWTGARAADLRPAMAMAKSSLTPVRVEGLRGDRWLCDAVPPDPIPRVRFLAKFDVLLLAHRDKSLWLDLDHLPRISRAAGQIEATILLNGRAAATYRVSKSKGGQVVAIEPFVKLSVRNRNAIEAELHRFSRRVWHGQTEPRWTGG